MILRVVFIRGLRFILQISMMILNLHFGAKKCENKKSKLIFILIQLSEMHRAGRVLFVFNNLVSTLG